MDLSILDCSRKMIKLFFNIYEMTLAIRCMMYFRWESEKANGMRYRCIRCYLRYSTSVLARMIIWSKELSPNEVNKWNFQALYVVRLFSVTGNSQQKVEDTLNRGLATIIKKIFHHWIRWHRHCPGLALLLSNTVKTLVPLGQKMNDINGAIILWR